MSDEILHEICVCTLLSKIICRIKQVKHFIQHAMLKFAMLKKMLDPFKRIQRKRADFIQHFIKEKKNHVGWSRNLFQNKFFFPGFSCILHQKYISVLFKVVNVQHLISNIISNVDFNIFERSNVKIS